MRVFVRLPYIITCRDGWSLNIWQRIQVHASQIACMYGCMVSHLVMLVWEQVCTLVACMGKCLLLFAWRYSHTTALDVLPAEMHGHNVWRLFCFLATQLD